MYLGYIGRPNENEKYSGIGTGGLSVILNLVLKKKKTCTGNITYKIEIDSNGQNSLIKYK